ncbi:MAG: ATP-binding protein [Succinivibrionaceae bacterium]|nr:ATP-binding protein [Succinivibrionaceae bacterium]
MLSGELATLLTGRTVEFEILPFSFYEVMLYFKLNGKEWDEETMFWNYLKYGGFPLRFDYKDETAILRYVSGLYQSIISRDIIGKSVGYDKSRFRDIALYILANAGKELSVDNVVASYSKSGGRQVSPRTVYNYLDRMKKAFLIHGVGSYNLSGKAALRSREKQYAVDTGFRTVSTNTVNIETSFFLENIVYNELLTRGFSVFTGRTYRGEIDFVAVKNGKKCFIQVAYVLANEETLEREFGAYRKIADASPKYVLSLDKPDLSRNGVAHLNLLDFLLRRKDLYLT